MLDPKKTIINYTAKGENFSVTLQEIILNIGFEYGLPDNVLALARENVEIIKIKMNKKASR